MAKTIVYILLFHLGIFCNVLDANKNHDNVSNANSISAYKSPTPSGFVYLAEHFDNREKFKTTWILSEAKKEDFDEDIAKYDGVWSVEEPKRSVQDGDLGLVLKSKARHAAISALLNTPFYFKDKPLIVQYEVTFQDGQECGGAYLKLLTLDSEHADLKKFHDKTPYTIMFGPDKCGNDHKLHFIFRHKNPLNGSIEEKHCKKPKERLEDFFKDKQPHLYTLIIRPDSSFDIKVDNKIVNSGSLLDDFVPPVNPPLLIEDPDDKQPEDWDDREKITDPLAEKPDDWDEDTPAQIVDEEDIMPEGWLEEESPMIPNPDSVKPDDWDVDMDGEWEPPEIPNPKCENVPGCGPYKQKMKKNPRYKGKWLPPLINNPNYKGKWKPRLVHNPNYFNDEHPFQMSPIFAIGFELWSMSPDIIFDNIIITDNEEVAQKWSDETFEVQRVKIAKESWTTWRQIATFTAEHPWMWAVYILVAGLPVLLVIYCCCFSSQEKYSTQEEEDKQPLLTNRDVGGEGVEGERGGGEEEEGEGKEGKEGKEGGGEERGVEEDENQKSHTELEKDAGNTSETEEIIDNKVNVTSPNGEDGPRRRKLNKNE